jgi:hypothetical protein
VVHFGGHGFRRGGRRLFFGGLSGAQSLSLSEEI